MGGALWRTTFRSTFNAAQVGHNKCLYKERTTNLDTKMLEAPKKRDLSVYAATFFPTSASGSTSRTSSVSLQYAERIKECMLVLGEVPSCKYPPHAMV